MIRALVCIATYNERANLPTLVERIFAQQEAARDVTLRVLVVDDNSPDGTGAWCDEQTAKDDRLQVIHRAGKLGLGSAMIEALQFGLGQGYELVATMDADHSHNPTVLPQMFRMAEAADVVIGSRYIPGGSIKNWPLRRRILSAGANFVARRTLGLTPRDCSSGYRVYRADALRRIDLGALRSSGYLFYEEILAYLQWAGCSVCELPIEFVNRVEGQSKIGLVEIFRAARLLAALARQRPRLTKAMPSAATLAAQGEVKR